jgi:nucleotide-binding universal stress UspA family protein
MACCAAYRKRARIRRRARARSSPFGQAPAVAPRRGMTVADSQCMRQRLSPVVVGYDLSRSGGAALTRAVTLAARAPHHVLHVVCVIDPMEAIPSIPAYNGIDHMYAARVQEAVAAEIRDELDRAEAEIDDRVHFFVHARIGVPAPEILELADEVGADLIIVGSTGLTGVERMLVGSTSERVVREARCTVEVARPKQYRDAELVPVEQVEPSHESHEYVPPHRYTYEDHRVNLRPAEWPLY